jgi:hypothetical protein
MRTNVAVLQAGLVLVMALGSGCTEPLDSPAQLEHLMHGNTPAEHKALVRFYRAKAAESREVAEKHRVMERLYLAKSSPMHDLSQHCKRVVDLNVELAVQYESLAKGAEEAALMAPASRDGGTSNDVTPSVDHDSNQND